MSEKSLTPPESADSVASGAPELEEIAQRLLGHAIDYGPRVVREVIRAAELYREGQVQTADELFTVVNDGLSVLIYASQASASELDSAGDSGPIELSKALLPPLNEIEEAYQKNDWIGVADALEYEVATIVSDWVKDAQGPSTQLVGESQA